MKTALRETTFTVILVYFFAKILPDFREGNDVLIKFLKNHQHPYYFRIFLRQYIPSILNIMKVLIEDYVVFEYTDSLSDREFFAFDNENIQNYKTISQKPSKRYYEGEKRNGKPHGEGKSFYY